MPYLGQEPAVGTYELLTLSESFDGSRTAFSILDSLNRAKGISNTNQLIVILNSITQHWGEAFTVSGSTMTFTSAPPSGSTVKILNIARHQVDIGKPSAGTVGTSELSATGTASSSTFLRGDNAWGAISSTSITDANNDTKIQVEEASDENKIRFDTAGSERMIIAADGSVGIGTTNPTRQMELKGSTENGPLVIDTAAGAHAGIWLKENATNRWQVYSEASSGDLAFFNYGTNDVDMRIKANGEVNVKTGDIVFGTAGKGICLGVTSNTAANTLDDYEEGTWDVTWVGTSGSAGSQSYHGDNSWYTKIGRLVIAHFGRAILNKGSWTGELKVTGLPFTSHANAEGMAYLSHFPGTAMDAAYRGGYIETNSTQFRIHKGSRMDYRVQYSEIDNGYYFVGTAIYITA